MTQLLAIVAVDFDERVQCRQPGCGHSVYRQIHVVQDGPELLILGSTCFAKRYGSACALGRPSYGGGGGRQLTDAERELLANNTAALLAQFEAEAQEEEERQRREASTRQIPPPLIARAIKPKSTQTFVPRSLGSPWPWAEPGRSMLYLHMQDGTAWIRVEHRDGYQCLVPWPKFDGWDETWPASVGLAEHELGCVRVQDIVPALTYMRQFAAWEKVVGSWRELNALLSR